MRAKSFGRWDIATLSRRLANTEAVEMAQGIGVSYASILTKCGQVWPGVPVTPELSEGETEGSLGLGGLQSNSRFKERHCPPK